MTKDKQERDDKRRKTRQERDQKTRQEKVKQDRTKPKIVQNPRQVDTRQDER